jgi:hypothetical protein
MLQNESGNVEKEESSSSYGFTGIDVANELSKAAKDLSGIPSQIGSLISTNLGLTAMFKAATDLDKKSSDIVKTLGTGFERSIELQRTLTLSIPQFVAMGLKADDSSALYESLIKKFNTNLKLTDGQLVDLAATAKVTGVGADELARNFRDVGFSIDSVGDNMLEVAKIANQAGVTVASVAGAVSKNIEKLNLFNFDNGVKGLAKMAAQSSRLGIDMDKIFAKAEDLLNPEKAIDFSASLQRLGVTSSELLDPLRAMDLAQNDPTELTNQIGKLGKEFVRFNEENKKFEILPGSKRRMREVAETLGMSASEFSKMAINASSFDEKLKKIKFSPDVSDDDRELVATMAQFSKEGVAQVKVKTFDETGKLTGEEKLVDVSKLTVDQISSLKAEQALQGESMEKIAINQLSEISKTNAILNEKLSAYQYGMAQGPLVKPAYSNTLKTIREGVDKLPSDPNSYINTLTEVEKKVSKILSDMGVNFDVIVNELGEYVETINDWFKTTTSSVGNYISNNASGSISVNDFEIRTLPQDKLVMAGGTNIDGSKNSNTSSNTGSNEVNMTHTFNFSNLPSYVTSTEVERILKEYTQNSQNALAMVNAAGKVNNGLTSKK